MASSIDTAVIFADRTGKELLPLFSDTCPALLPIVGKSPLEYCLDDIASANFKRAIIIISSCSERIQQLIGNGDAWGLDIEYVLSRGEESPEALLGRFSTLSDDPFLALRGDVLRSSVLSDLLDSNQEQNVQIKFDNNYAGIAITNKSNSQVSSLSWPPQTVELENSKSFSGCKINTLSSLDDFRIANLSFLQREFKDVVLKGLEKSEDIRTGRLSYLPSKAVVDTPVYVGDHSSVHQSCGIYGPVVIGDDCYIDRDTQISASVILPGTYIGAGLDIKDAIVGEGMLVNTSEDITVQIDDPLWVAPMEQRGIASDVSRIEQLFVLALLVLTLPLWPIAALLSLGQSRPLLKRETILGNKRGIRGQRLESRFYYWATTIPVFRYLPGLLSVATGHIRMFGMKLVDNDNSANSILKLKGKTEQPPYGLVSPASLYLKDDAPPEEVELFEICFSAERGLHSEIKCWARLASRLFTASAWQSGNSNR